MPYKIQDHSAVSKTKPVHADDILRQTQTRTESNKRRHNISRHFPREVEKAMQELKIQESFFTKLARDENIARGFSEGGSNKDKTDMVSTIRKAKHETAEALQYVYPDTSLENMASIFQRHTNCSEPKQRP